MGNLKKCNVKVEDLCKGFLFSPDVVIVEAVDIYSPLYEGRILYIPDNLMNREIKYLAPRTYCCMLICLA